MLVKPAEEFDPTDSEEEPVEIEIVEEVVDPELQGLIDQAIDTGMEMAEENAGMLEFSANLADFLPDEVLSDIASNVISDVDLDSNSRRDWETVYKDGLDLLGLKIDKRTSPWKGACGVFHPIINEAVIKFQAEAITETFPASGPVRTKLIGKATAQNEKAAKRVEADMNLWLTERIPEYRSEHEKLLWALPIAGSAFKKVYYDPTAKRPKSMAIQAEDLLVPYGASDLTTAERVTHVMRKTKNEVERLQASGFYVDCDLGDPASFTQPIAPSIAKKKDELKGTEVIRDDRFTLYEQHVFLTIEDDPICGEDGLAKPYVVTVDKDSSKVLAIYRNWSEDDETYQKRNHFVHYTYIPGFGFYGYGLIHLIGGHADAATSLMRQLVDAGTLANLSGGFKTRGLRIKGDNTPLEPGEWRDVDVPSGKIADNLFPVPYKEPSQTLLALLDKIVGDAKELLAMTDIKFDATKETPVGTTLAVLERTLKVMSAVQARMHDSMKHEFKLVAAIIREQTPDEYDYEPESGDEWVKGSDYDTVEIIPVSDPNASTMAQRVVQYQAVIQLSQSAPQLYNLPELHRSVIEALGVQNASKLVPVEDDYKPSDPVSENMAVLTGKPVKAFLYQNHDAHLQVHMAAIQDPLIQQMIGQNPQAQKIMAAAMAHVQEHVAFKYRKEIENQLGVPLPDPETPLPEDTEYQMSSLVAEAAQRLLAGNQQRAAQKKAQEQAKDPVIQMQMKELQIKEQEAKRKAMEAMEKAALEKAKLQSKEQADQTRAAVELIKKLMDLGAEQQSEQAAREQSNLQKVADIGMNILQTQLNGANTNDINQAGGNNGD